MAPIDAIQSRFLRGVNVSDKEALFYFHMAPLSVRRDIAILGLIHRTVIGAGPAQFSDFFMVEGHSPMPRAPRRHYRHLKDVCKVRSPDYLLHSALGGIRLYNLLPDAIISATTVAIFQRRLQKLVCARAHACEDWRDSLSWRVPLWSHPLRGLRDWHWRG